MTPKHMIRSHERLPFYADPRVWAEIDRRALADNWRDLCAHVTAASPHTYAMAIVKADAYGHGVYPVVPTLLDVGCRSFALACPEEAVAARQTVRDAHLPDEAVELLVLGYTPITDVLPLAEYRIATTVLSEVHARALSEAAISRGVTVDCHIAIDTGMNRIGLSACSDQEISAAAKTVCRICALPGLRVTGCFTHLACADEALTEVSDPQSRTLVQYRRFLQLKEALPPDLPPMTYHICNSAAAVRFPDALPEGCMDAVRLGISLYGYGVDTVDGRPMGHRPVMKLKTTVVHTHTLLPGERLGYGGDFTSDTPRAIATLPVGYADGFLRAFRGASVTVHTKRGDVKAPIVGRICMDQCMIDVTDLGVSVGDTVTLFGDTRESLLELARRAETIPYEILCLITARVPRIIC